MTHSFSYKYGLRPYYFLWDTESGSLHNVDYLVFLLSKRAHEGLSTEENADLGAFAVNQIREAEEEIGELSAQGVYDCECTAVADEKRHDRVKALCLHICNDCNLRCAYCFADEGTYGSARREHMSAEVGKRAVDFLIEASGDLKNLEIDFFGGEPLMNLDAVKEIVDYARSRESRCGKHFDFTMTTNCVLLNKDTARWLNDEMHNVVLSIDGRRSVHDGVRRAVNGKPCYNLIVDNALYFRSLRGDKSYYVRGTFTAKNLDFCADVLALNDMGFDKISMEPVVTDIPELTIRREHLPKIFEEYDKLAAEYIERRKGEKYFDFFHFMIDLEYGPCIKKRFTGCGSGCEYLAVTPTGELYPCHQFAEKSGYRLGSVFEGITDHDIPRRFARNVVTRKPTCLECIAKYYCSGGCAANNVNFSGSMGEPYDISCAMMKKRMELSLAIAAIEAAGV